MYDLLFVDDIVEANIRQYFPKLEAVYDDLQNMIGHGICLTYTQWSLYSAINSVINLNDLSSHSLSLLKDVCNDFQKSDERYICERDRIRLYEINAAITNLESGNKS